MKDMKIKDIILTVVMTILVGVFIYSLFWGTPVFKVTFDSNGGSDINVQEIKQDEEVSKPTVPTKDGYEFVEWQLNGETYDFSTPVDSNITLTAVWKEVAESK